METGTILTYTWGWEQTNVNFYQVTGRTASFVKLRPIESVEVERGDMRGKVIPKRDAFAGAEIRRKPDCHGLTVKMDYDWAQPWSGEPVNYTSYA